MFSIEISLVFFIFDGFYAAGSTEYTYFVLEYKMYRILRTIGQWGR
jgi:hypothetical protein